MTRDEFLRELRIALQGRIPQAQVNEHLQFYENYIIEESRKGKTEHEALESLGNPRLIAKTIIETSGSSPYQDMQAKGSGEEGNKSGWKSRLERFEFRSWYGRLLSGVVFIILLALLVQIGIVLLPVLASAVMAGAILYIIYLIFFGNKK